jgi:hypothetical protein
MRNKIRLSVGNRPLPCLGAIAGILLLFPGCLKDKVTETYKVYTPIYGLKANALAAINGSPAQPVSQAGQLYIKGNYIYLNDIDKGIHIYDNSDPSHPVQTAYLSIPGNENIAINGNILYADMYEDLLAIDISDPHQVKLVGSLRDFFFGRNTGIDSNIVITGWNIRDTTFPGQPGTGMYPVPMTNIYTFYSAAVPAAAQAANAAGKGIAGSTAVMTMIGNYLFAIPEQHSLGVVDISDATNPTKLYSQFAGDDLETIFPLQDKLLLGSKEGVYVYSISNPSQPTQITEFQHGTACDPVIADSGYAYVTLHSGTSCGGSANELDVLSAADITNATLVKTYPMTKPTGLAKDGGLLFVCDGSVVKVFDASDPSNLQLLTSLAADNPNDVIAYDHLLLVVTTGGLYQFDYSDPGNITKLSFLPINNSKS